jgi:hypothetical protein
MPLGLLSVPGAHGSLLPRPTPLMSSYAAQRLP